VEDEEETEEIEEEFVKTEDPIESDEENESDEEDEGEDEDEVLEDVVDQTTGSKIAAAKKKASKAPNYDYNSYDPVTSATWKTGQKYVRYSFLTHFTALPIYSLLKHWTKFQRLVHQSKRLNYCAIVLEVLLPCLQRI